MKYCAMTGLLRAEVSILLNVQTVGNVSILSLLNLLDSRSGVVPVVWAYFVLQIVKRI